MSDGISVVDPPAGVFKFAEGNPLELVEYSNEYRSNFAPNRPLINGPNFMLWQCDVELVSMNREKAIEFDGFMAMLRARNFAFRISDPFRRYQRGAGAGFSDSSPTLKFTAGSNTFGFDNGFAFRSGSTVCTVRDDAARYDDKIVLSGLVANAQVFKRGDVIEIGGNPYMTGTAVSDANGHAQVDIFWKLWKPAIAGDTVKLRDPSGRFTLADRQSGRAVRNRNDFSNASIVAIEVPYMS